MARTVYAEPQKDRFSVRRIATWTGWFAAAAAFALAAGIWIDQNMRPAMSTIAIGENTQAVEAEPAIVQEQRSERTLRDDFYSAGIDLQSRTFEGALPAHAFRTASVTREAEPAPVIEAPVVRENAIASAMPITDEVSMAALMTPQTALMPSRSDQAIVTLTPTRVITPTIDREDADALYAASILMHLLTAADARSFADVEHVRQVVEVDNLLSRLTEARDRLQPVDRPAVFAAESVLTRVTQGPLDTNDMLSLRDTVAKLNLSDELGEITDRWDRGSSL